MKTNKPPRRFKPWMIGLLLLVFAGGLLFALEKTGIINFIGSDPSDRAAASGPTKEQEAQQAKADAQTKQNYLDNSSKAENPDTSTPTTGNSSDLTVTASQEGSSVTVLTQMHEVTAGNCALTATNNGKTTSQNAQIIYQPEFSSCAGFTIQASSLGVGKWNISVTITPDTGTAVTKSTTLEVK